MTPLVNKLDREVKREGGRRQNSVRELMRGGSGEEIKELDTASQQTKARERQVRVERKFKRKRKDVMGEDGRDPQEVEE